MPHRKSWVYFNDRLVRYHFISSAVLVSLIIIADLKNKYTIIIVTHNMHQASRVSDRTAFFLNGELIEEDVTSILFTRPGMKKTEDYISGRFG